MAEHPVHPACKHGVDSLVQEAQQGLADVTAGRVKDARTTLMALKRRRASQRAGDLDATKRRH